MGIKGIKNLIKKNAPDSIVPFDTSQLRGKTIAIDSSILLYKYRYLYDSDNFHILGFTSKIKELELLGVIPFFVFDGTPPKAKERVLSERSDHRKKQKDRLLEISKELGTYKNYQNVCEFIESDDEDSQETQEILKIKKLLAEQNKIKKNLLIVTKNHSKEVMEFLKSLGITFFEAPGEAEKECAFLQKTGKVDYILTEDTDSLAFGGSNIIFTKHKNYELCKLELVLSGLQISYESFVDLCILCGCDYTGTIPKVGPVTALKLIKKHLLIEHIPIKIPDSFEYKLARSLILN
jgi:flap endonuclease-1